MSKLSAESFLNLIRQSGLIEKDRLARLRDDLQQRGVDLTDSSAVATALVEQEQLTRWQADKLLQGRHKGFALGKYRLLTLLGKGGMSSVYLAEHVLMRRRCAIKVLPIKRVKDSSYLARFHREAQAVASLDHPNIVRAYDVDQEVEGDREVHFLVMEYINGRSIQDIVREDGPLSVEDTAEYFRQAALGLAHAHHCGLVHRDVKPGNLLVDRSGVVKVLDLGLARFQEVTEENPLTMLHDEKVLGTADYLSPEQALDSHQVDGRADIYSLGCSIYFGLTGYPPFRDGTLAQRLLWHQTREPESPAAVRPELNETEGGQALLVLLRKMMARNPADRFQTMDEVAQVLGEWLEQYARPEWREQRSSGKSGSGSGTGLTAVVTSGSSPTLPAIPRPEPAAPAVAAATDSPPAGGSPDSSQPSEPEPTVPVPFVTSPRDSLHCDDEEEEVMALPSQPADDGFQAFLNQMGGAPAPAPQEETPFFSPDAGGFPFAPQVDAGAIPPADTPAAPVSPAPAATPAPAPFAAAVPAPPVMPAPVPPPAPKPVPMATAVSAPTPVPLVQAVPAAVPPVPVASPIPPATPVMTPMAVPVPVAPMPVAPQVPPASHPVFAAPTAAPVPAAPVAVPVAQPMPPVAAPVAPIPAAPPVAVPVPAAPPVAMPVPAPAAPVPPAAPQPFFAQPVMPASMPPAMPAAPVFAPPVPTMPTAAAVPVATAMPVAQPAAPPAAVPFSQPAAAAVPQFAPPAPVVPQFAPQEPSFAAPQFIPPQPAAPPVSPAPPLAAPFAPAAPVASVPSAAPQPFFGEQPVAASFEPAPFGTPAFGGQPFGGPTADVSAAPMFAANPPQPGFVDPNAPLMAAPLMSAPAPMPAAGPASKPSARGKKKPVGLIIGAVVVLAAVAAGGFLFLGGDAKDAGKASTSASSKAGTKKKTTKAGSTGAAAASKAPKQLGSLIKVGPGGDFPSITAALSYVKANKSRYDTFSRRVTVTLEVTGGETFSEAIVIDSSLPNGVAIVAKGSGRAKLAAPSGAPAVKVTDVEHFILDSFDITGARDTALELSGYLKRCEFKNLTISGFKQAGVQGNGVAGLLDDLVVISAVDFRPADAGATGIRLGSGNVSNARVKIHNCRMFGPQKAGVVLEGGAVNIELRECIIDQAEHGVRFGGTSAEWKEVALINNTFHEISKGAISFQEMPAASSFGLAFNKNLFAKLSGPELHVESGFDDKSFDRFLSSSNAIDQNWSDRKQMAKPEAGEREIIAREEQRADVRFSNNDHNSPDYLSLAGGQRPAAIGGALRQSKPWVGARGPK